MIVNGTMVAQRYLPLHHLHKHITRNTNSPHHLHLLLTFLLLLKQFLLTRDISSITLSDHVFTHRRDCFTSNHLSSNSSLKRNSKHMFRNQFFQLFYQFSPSRMSLIFMNYEGKCFYFFMIDQHI